MGGFYLLWIIVGSIALNFLFSYLRAILQESIGYEVAAGQRIHLGDVLKRVPLGYFSQNSVGDILAGVTTELSTLELQGMKMVDVIINGYAKFIAIVLCLIFFSPVAAVISIVGVALSALALQGISRHSEKTAATTHKAMEDMSGAAIEYIRGLSIVKSFGQEGASIENFRNASKELKDIHIKVEKGYTPYNCLHLFVLKLASMGIVLVCAWQALQGQMSISVFLMFVLFSFVLFGSVENINDAAHTLGVIDSAMNKLEALENVNYIDQDGTDIKPATYDIEFRDVSFGYDSRIVLHDLNFKIPQNSTTAIVGPSGSGKSTLCNLIARFYDVNSGTITVGGTDIRRFTCDSLLKNISMVFQNVYLFRDTIKNNIKFGSPDATDEQIIAAAKAARCHDFIMALPDGYDTVIGENGANLSGGQRQRLAIARALLRDMPVLLLDEATSALDSATEQEVMAGLMSDYAAGRTMIIVAHRISTLKEADLCGSGSLGDLGSHMLEVCPTIATADKPILDVQPLGIGGKADPARLIFNTQTGPALVASLIDLGDRFRLLVNTVETVPTPHDLPKLPVANALWKAQPDLRTASEAWIIAGGAHHTVFSHALNLDDMRQFAELHNIELTVIDNDTRLPSFKDALRWNEVYYGSKR